MPTGPKTTSGKGNAAALRQKNNEWSNKYFAIAIGAMTVIAILYHWINVIYFHYGRGKENVLVSRVILYRR